MLVARIVAVGHQWRIPSYLRPCSRQHSIIALDFCRYLGLLGHIQVSQLQTGSMGVHTLTGPSGSLVFHSFQLSSSFSATGIRVPFRFAAYEIASLLTMARNIVASCWHCIDPGVSLSAGIAEAFLGSKRGPQLMNLIWLIHVLEGWLPELAHRQFCYRPCSGTCFRLAALAFVS
jgi:hypothetical protein